MPAFVRSSALVANDAGGVGKTLTSRLLLLARPGSRAVGFDRRKDGASSKLAVLLAVDRVECLDLVSYIDRSQLAVGESGMAVYDVLGDVILKGSAVIDSGSRGVGGLEHWARVGGGAEYLREERAPVLLVIPVVAVAASIKAARDVAELLGARGMLDAFPPLFVFNGVYGEFDEVVGNVDLDWIQGRVAAGRARCVVMPKCRGSVLAYIEAERLGFDEALTIEPGAFAKRFDVPEGRALWWLRCFAEFVAGVLDGFANAGVGRAPDLERARFIELDRAWRTVSAKLRAELVGRVEATAASPGERPAGILRKIDQEDAALLVEAFPDTLNVLGREIYGAVQRGLKPDFNATRRAVEEVFAAQQERQARAGIHPRLGAYRRDVVIEAKRRGIDVASHRVAAVSYVQDLQDLGRAGFWRALRFLTQYHAETVLLKLRVIRERTWPPKLY